MVHFIPLLKFIIELNKQTVSFTQKIKIVIIYSIRPYIAPNRHDFPSYVEHKKKRPLCSSLCNESCQAP